MKSENKTKLDQILDTFDKHVSDADEVAERRKSERELFLEAFAEKVETVVRPVLEDMAAALRDRGHETDISERNESAGESGSPPRAGITLTVFPGGKDPSYMAVHHYPHVAFMTDSSKNNIYVHESTMTPKRGGQAGSVGSYELEEVTTELVEKHVLDVLAKAMGRR